MLHTCWIRYKYKISQGLYELVFFLKQKKRKKKKNMSNLYNQIIIFGDSLTQVFKFKKLI
jgi:hypothetical protein